MQTCRTRSQGATRGLGPWPLTEAEGQELSTDAASSRETQESLSHQLVRGPAQAGRSAQRGGPNMCDPPTGACALQREHTHAETHTRTDVPQRVPWAEPPMTETRTQTCPHPTDSTHAHIGTSGTCTRSHLRHARLGPHHAHMCPRTSQTGKLGRPTPLRGGGSRGAAGRAWGDPGRRAGSRLSPRLPWP